MSCYSISFILPYYNIIKCAMLFHLTYHAFLHFDHVIHMLWWNRAILYLACHPPWHTKSFTLLVYILYIRPLPCQFLCWPSCNFTCFLTYQTCHYMLFEPFIKVMSLNNAINGSLHAMTIIACYLPRHAFPCIYHAPTS